MLFFSLCLAFCWITVQLFQWRINHEAMEARASGPQFLDQKNWPPHSDSVQIFEVINLYHTVWPSTKVSLRVDVRLRLTQVYAVVCRIGYIDIICAGMPEPLLACQNALKLTYSNVEFQNFSGGGPPGREGEGRGGVDPWPPAPKTIIRHWLL